MQWNTIQSDSPKGPMLIDYTDNAIICKIDFNFNLIQPFLNYVIMGFGGGDKPKNHTR